MEDLILVMTAEVRGIFRTIASKGAIGLCVLMLTSVEVNAEAGSEIGSIATDITRECVTISASNETSDIDFLTMECKAFGGFQLFVGGGDLKYHPALFFEGREIDLQWPKGFHDTGSASIDWIYSLATTEDGEGTLEWRGLVYALMVSDESGINKLLYYAVRLNREKSCLLGRAETDTEAWALVSDESLGCLVPQ